MILTVELPEQRLPFLAIAMNMRPPRGLPLLQARHPDAFAAGERVGPPYARVIFRRSMRSKIPTSKPACWRVREMQDVVSEPTPPVQAASPASGTLRDPKGNLLTNHNPNPAPNEPDKLICPSPFRSL
jgi:hypothetical protein